MNANRRLSLVCLALALSGGGSLAVEVLWQRLLARLVGGSTASLTAVLAAYMGGLALGAAIAGRWGDRLSPQRALRAYLWLEVGIAITAVATTLLVGSLPAGLSSVLAAAPEGPVRHAVRVLFASLILLVPTTAMGATLPLAVRAIVGNAESGLLQGTGRLYAANTAGAVAGTLIAPFFLLPAFGMVTGALVAIAGNLAAAAVAVLALRVPPSPAAEAPPPSDTERATAPPPRGLVAAVLLAAFATGATALGFEVLWTRGLTHHVGSSAHAFGAVLALVLGGITLGSMAASAERRIRQPALLCGVLMVLGPALAVTLYGVQEQIPPLLVSLGQRGRLSLDSSLLVLLGVGAGVILPATVCFGAALPLAIRVAREAGRGDATARSVGRVYVANTAGAILGAATAGLFLLPWLGRRDTGLLLAGVGILAGAFLLVYATRGDRQRRLIALGLVAVAASTLLLAPRDEVFAGSPHERAIRLAGTRAGLSSISGNRPLYFAEGPEASVAVESDGMLRAFYVAGRPEASNGPRDMRTQYLLGHLPAILGGGARRSLVIGLGSGMTAGALTVHGDVTIAELNRAVPGATRTFGDLNHQVLDHARLRIEDGRIILAEPAAPWNLITTDPIHPYIAGSALLYTQDHFSNCRERLAPAGSVSLWLPLFSMGGQELRAIIGAFVDAFPESAELYLLSANDALLVGGGLARDQARTLALLAQGWSPAVAEDLERALLATPDEVAALRVAGPRELAAFAAGVRRNRDDDPWIEITLPRFKYVDTVPDNVRQLLALRTGADAEAPLARLHAVIMEAYVLIRQGKNAEALELLARAQADGLPPTLEHRVLTRETSATLAVADFGAGRRDAALARARAEAVHPDAQVRSLVLVAPVLARLGAWAEVADLGKRLMRQWPERAEGPLFLAESHLARAEHAAAIPLLEQALALDLHDGWAWRTLAHLGRAHLVEGKVAEGRAYLRRSLALRPHQSATRKLLGSSEASAGALARQQLASGFGS